MPYRIGVHWFEVALFSCVILLVSTLAIGWFREGRPGSQFRPGLANRNSGFIWFDLAVGLICATVLVRDIFWSVVFSDTQIEYRFFWIRRWFRYEDLVSIRPINHYNLTARFSFRDGAQFKYPLAYYDADYLLEILEQRSPSVLPELAALRDALTPRWLRPAQ